MEEIKPTSDASQPAAEPAAGKLTPERVFHEYLPRVYRLARHMLGNDTDAEDVTQDVFVQLMRKLSTFRGESAFTTWLHHVTVNSALAYRRKRHTRNAHRVSDPLEEFLEDGSHAGPVRRWNEEPEKTALERETHQIIDEAIARMPEVCRDVFVLADVEGLPNAQIAEMLALSLPAVKSRLHRARMLMRVALAPHFEEVTP